MSRDLTPDEWARERGYDTYAKYVDAHEREVVSDVEEEYPRQMEAESYNDY